MGLKIVDRMSNFGKSSTKVKITVLYLFLWEFLNVTATCSSPQYAEYGQQGVIKCNFASGFIGVYWFLFVNPEYQGVIRLEQQEDGTFIRLGNGYSEGNYDITLDGSLVISNITNYKTQNYKVVHVNEELHVDEHYVELLTAIFPDSKFPLINVCNKTNVCLLENTNSSLLTCSYNSSKPPVDLVWYKQSHEGTKRLHGETVITKDGNWTFSSVLTTNIINVINGPLISFSCRVVNPALKTEVFESTVVFDTSQQPWYSQLESVEREMWFLIHSKAKVPCNDQNKPLIFVWKKVLGSTTNSLMYVSVGDQYRVTSGTWNISHDGTLVFPNIRLGNEGVYTCMVFDGNRYVLNMVQVNVWAKPTPFYIFTDDCLQDEEPCEIIVKDKNTPFNISCHLNEVYPNMTLALETDSDTAIIKQTIYSSKIGNVYNITTTAELSPIDCNAPIKVTCSLSIPVQLIKNKVISVRLEECEAAGASVLLTVMVIIIVIIIGVICAILSYRFRYRFRLEKATRKNSNPETEPLSDPSTENQKTQETQNQKPEAQPLNDYSTEHQNTEERLDTDQETELFKDISTENQNTEDTLDTDEADPSHSGSRELSFILVEHCEKIADDLLHWPVHRNTKIFNELAVGALKIINEKMHANRKKKKTNAYNSYLDKFHIWIPWIAESSPEFFNQFTKSEDQKGKEGQVVGEIESTLNTYIRLQRDLLRVTSSLALLYDILKTVSKNSNFSDDKYSTTDFNGIQTQLGSLEDDEKYNQDLSELLSKVDKHIDKFLTVLQNFFLQREEADSEQRNYLYQIEDRNNINLARLPPAFDTLLGERKITGNGEDILYFVTAFYLQGFKSQEGDGFTTLNIKESNEKIQVNITMIAEGVTAAATELGAIGKNVNTNFLGSREQSVYMNEDRGLKMNAAMIKTMEKMNVIARSMKPLP